MKPIIPFVCALFAVGCARYSAQVQVTDTDGDPVEGFPLRFELDDGLKRTNFLGGEVMVGPIDKPGADGKVRNQIYETETNDEGSASIHYDFKDRQPPDWKIGLGKEDPIPDQSIHIIPLRPLPAGSRVSITMPNP